VVFTAAPVALDGAAAHVDVIQLDPGELTLTTVLRRLRSEFAVASLLCEGGPTMFGALLRERLVDELFLTLVAKLVGGGGGPTISSGPELKEIAPMRVLWALEHDGGMYLRYALH
jgi:riboflavin biosynthesis pyrimidine reductase